MLWFCAWQNRPSVILVAESPKEAAKLAGAIASDGYGASDPAVGLAITAAPWFAAELDEDDAGDLFVAPFDHVWEKLEELDDAGPSDDTVEASCPAEADGPTGEPVTCAKDKGHAGEHEAGDLVWS